MKHTILRKLILPAAALVTTATFTLATPSEASAQIELGIGFGYAGNVDDDADDWNGFTFSLFGGYRINDLFGLYLAQDLGGMSPENADERIAFYGATMLEGRIFFNVRPLEMYGKIGLGAVYMNEDDDAYGWHHDWDNTWFGLRLGLGATYMINANVALGLSFDYTPSFDDDHVDHFLRLLAYLSYRF